MNNEGDALSYVVPDTYSGQRADKVLSLLCEDLSRSRLKGLITQKQVFVNGALLSSPSQAVREGDVLSFNLPKPVPAEPEPENIALDIIYEDEHMLVVNKGVGMVVHPGAGNWSGTLVNALLYHCAGALSGIGGVIRPGIVHRLDKDTSGLMMVAKSDQAHQALSAQLADRSLSRVYHAFVMGVPVPLKGAIDLPIGRHKHNRLKMCITPGVGGREAFTHYKVLKSFGEACSLVECRLKTGRTHQIRVHMEALGYPLIGDPLYGPQPTALKAKLKKEGYPSDIIEEITSFSRQALHAQSLHGIHPESGEKMVFTEQAPDDLCNLLKKLEKSA